MKLRILGELKRMQAEEFVSYTYDPSKRTITIKLTPKKVPKV